jgi:hypothetical protein
MAKIESASNSMQRLAQHIHVTRVDLMQQSLSTRQLYLQPFECRALIRAKCSDARRLNQLASFAVFDEHRIQLVCQRAVLHFEIPDLRAGIDKLGVSVLVDNSPVLNLCERNRPSSLLSFVADLMIAKPQ